MSTIALADRKVIDAINPATLEKIGQVEMLTNDEVAKAVDLAREIQPFWESLPVRERCRYIARARDYLVDHIDEVTETISKENGKPRMEALSSDVFPVIYLMDYFISNARKLLSDEPVDIRIWRLTGRRSYLHRTARGVVGVISPWNFPFSIPTGEIVMALIAGNAVLLKPSRDTALIGERIGEVFAAAGLPEGVFQVVQGSGAALMDQKLDFIAFTGSVETGKKVMAKAAETLTPVMLELGGKDPMIVLKDCNMEVAAAAAVWGGFTNSGQVCASVERLYVDESIADDFVELVVSKAERLRQGIGMDWNTDIGCMTNEDQLNIVIGQVERARAAGAEILLGGERNDAFPGYFYKPTILRGVKQSDECVQEETFGPTLPILTFGSEAEAVELANDSQFGLTASVWTRDIDRGEALARRVIAGTVMVNDCVFSHGMAETPWGGYKDTGIGRTHGKYGLYEFTEVKHIHINSSTNLKNPWWYQYSEEGYQAFKSTSFLLRSGFGAKVKSAAGLRPFLQSMRKAL